MEGCFCSCRSVDATWLWLARPVKGRTHWLRRSGKIRLALRPISTTCLDCSRRPTSRAACAAVNAMRRIWWSSQPRGIRKLTDVPGPKRSRQPLVLLWPLPGARPAPMFISRGDPDGEGRLFHFAIGCATSQISSEVLLVAGFLGGLREELRECRDWLFDLSRQAGQSFPTHRGTSGRCGAGTGREETWVRFARTELTRLRGRGIIVSRSSADDGRGSRLVARLAGGFELSLMPVFLILVRRCFRDAERNTIVLDVALPVNGGGCKPFLMKEVVSLGGWVRMNGKPFYDSRAICQLALLLACARFDVRHLEDPDWAFWNKAVRAALLEKAMTGPQVTTREMGGSSESFVHADWGDFGPSAFRCARRGNDGLSRQQSTHAPSWRRCVGENPQMLHDRPGGKPDIPDLPPARWQAPDWRGRGQTVARFVMRLRCRAGNRKAPPLSGDGPTSLTVSPSKMMPPRWRVRTAFLDRRSSATLMVAQ